ncbi:hypothetical protein ACTMU2_33475 [Cupriavidus basilensis]
MHGHGQGWRGRQGWRSRARIARMIATAVAEAVGKCAWVEGR